LRLEGDLEYRRLAVAAALHFHCRLLVARSRRPVTSRVLLTTPCQQSLTAPAIAASAALARPGRLGGQLLFACEPLVVGLHDPAGEAEQAEQPDCPVGDVELPPEMAMPGRARIGVVVVVPALAHRRVADDEVVAAVLVGLVGAVAPEMGDRVDRPGV